MISFMSEVPLCGGTIPGKRPLVRCSNVLTRLRIPFSRFLTRSSVQGGLDVIRKEALVNIQSSNKGVALGEVCLNVLQFSRIHGRISTEWLFARRCDSFIFRGDEKCMAQLFWKFVRKSAGT